ncbi:PqqD family protein [Synechococcus sp. ATX 2A4]|uniref:PqqD family protein n=1 Tax=Synechococcus sp. ATX 2A4 TaxID=2823727 RepID=UPI0020CF8001|nr:PqqD family protein [Synechococcus sp. ATX 2A4]MCP9885538.1 PqqD family protein [Synechococcus sp. ATX 2A4]
MTASPTNNPLRFADAVRFAHETVEGETVVVDARDGVLYLLSGLGGVFWEHLLNGAVPTDLATEAGKRYGPEAAASTLRFLELLDQRGMLKDDPTGDGEQATAPIPWPETFAAPVLDIYDDIANIIAMDPIHDVKPSAGWPMALG